MKPLLSHRTVYFLGFLFICALLGAAAYLQYYDNVTPCPLCILQRFVLIALGVVFLLGAAFNPRGAGRIIMALMSILVTLLGIALAGRQVWLQHFPAGQGESCGTSLQYMLQVMPVNEVILKVFQGGAECSQVGWQFMDLSLAEWSLGCFIVFALISLWQLRRPQ